MKLSRKQFRRQCENAYRQYSLFGGASRGTVEMDTRRRPKAGGWGLCSLFSRSEARAR